MTSPTMPGPADGVPGPDSAPTPASVYGAALQRVTRWVDYAGTHSATDLVFHIEAPGGGVVQLFGSDLKMMLLGAIAWHELLPLLAGGLSGGTRAAVDRVRAFGERYEQVSSTTRVVCVVDGVPLNAYDVAHIAHVLGTVDQVAKRNPIEGTGA